MLISMKCIGYFCVPIALWTVQWFIWSPYLLQMLVIFGTPLVGRLGYFRIIRYNFVWKLISGLTMYFLIGPSNAWLIMLFLILDRCIFVFSGFLKYLYIYIPAIFWNHCVHLPACPSVTKVSKHYREVFFCTRQQTLGFLGGSELEN